MKLSLSIASLFVIVLATQTAGAAEPPAEYKLVINNHQFDQTELTIPSGKKIKLTVVNMDSTPEEFDSHSLNREKVISGNSTATIFIGPLSPGRYPFIGEFHASTAQGTIIAK